MNMSACWRSLYETTKPATDRTTSTRTSAVTGRIKAERIKHPRLRPSHVRDLDRIKSMPLKIKESRGRLEMLNGPSHDLVGHRFGVRNQFCHFDERYHALRCTVDIVRMQPVM